MMNKVCTGCGETKLIEDFPLQSDRPGKRRSKCLLCYRAYTNQRCKEYYQRNQEELVQRARDYRQANPDVWRAWWAEYGKRPEVIERRRAYMKTYKRPWRELVGDTCERCGYTSRSEDRRDMDIHHRDENKHNNDPSNLELLCSNCHRLVEHTPSRRKAR